MIDERYVEDGFGLSDNVEERFCPYEALGSALLFADDVVSASVLGFVLDSSLFIDAVANYDEPPRDCIVLNTPRMEPSVYTGFNFNSFALFDGELFAAGPGGIYCIDAPDDDGVSIETGVLFPFSDLGVLSDKRFRKVFLNYAGSTRPKVQLSARSDSEVGVIVETHDVVRSGAIFSRGLRGKEFSLAISNFDVLSRVELFMVTLVRGR